MVELRSRYWKFNHVEFFFSFVCLFREKDEFLEWIIDCFFFFLKIGFLAYLALGKTHDEAIEAGSYCAYECIQQSGCTYPDKPNFTPNTFKQ